MNPRSILLAPQSNSGITPMGLLERCKGTSSTPSHRPSVAAAHRTPQDGRLSVAPSDLPLCLCSSHCHPAGCSVFKKRSFLALLRCKNASLRRTFCCVVHQKRDFKAHPAASTTLLLVGSFQLVAVDSRLSTHHSSSTLDLDSLSRSRLSKLAIRLPLVWTTARPRVRLWP